MATRATSSPPPADAYREPADVPANDASEPLLIASRYEVASELGRGGMAVVFRVFDRATQRHLALKCMQAERDPERRRATEALFEAEFRTLSQLQHPRVIQVFDYGVDQGCAYYTMELLDGGDLSQLAPLPWREACSLIYDVCSSLALLHSRRLVHRDVSPRNIRRTRDGRPKLIDFGAMASMGPCAQAVGTPAFVAPEVAQRATLDGRTDLFSLGSTLYYALTRRPPYPARTFAQLHEVWSIKPAPVSSFAPDAPPALDGLIQSLLSLEPALRPRSAFDVMQRLAAIANLPQTEALSVANAYLAMPTLIARDELLATVRRRALRADGGSGSSLLIQGPPGSGRTRALDAVVLQLKTSGIITLRGGAQSSGRRSFALVQSLAEQLLEALPELALEAARAEDVAELILVSQGAGADAAQGFRVAHLPSHAAERARLLDALSKWFLNVAKTRTLAVAADDVDHADDASAAFLGALADQARRHRLLLASSTESIAQADPEALAIKVLKERSRSLALEPFTPEQTQAMFDSVFGDVPHVPILADRIHRVALGNARISMELAQHLVEQNAITYAAGTWTLPATLDQAALPGSIEAAFAARIAALSALARRLAECHALAWYRGLTRDDHSVLAGAASHEATMRALDELREREVLSTDGELWAIAQAVFVPVLLAGLDDTSRADRHRALGELGESAGKLELATVHHLLSAGLTERGLDRLAKSLLGPPDAFENIVRWQLLPNPTCELLEHALEQAERAGRPPRMCAEIRRWIMVISGTNDERFYARAAPVFLAQVRRDSGRDDWDTLASSVPDAGPRLMASFQAATDRYNATPPEQRVYSPEEALKFSVLFVVVSITTGARVVDPELICSLPDLIEPYRALAPIIDAMWNNAVATREMLVEARFFQARERWIAQLERLSQLQGRSDVRYFKEIRGAIILGVGCLEGGRGFPTAESWAARLDSEPLQRVNGMYLHKVARLQLGDWEGAERYRRAAELLAVQAASTPLLYGSQVIELTAHAMASDLPGVQQIAARLTVLAQKYPNWRQHSLLATGYFELLRGDPQAALVALEHGLALCSPREGELRSMTAWPSTAGTYLQALVELNRIDEARQFGERALADAERLDIRTMDDVIRGLALAETKLGQYPQACARLQALIDRQLGMGVIGLHLGATYEARARIAIWAGDQAAVETYAKMTAEQYRHGHGSPLGARYEVLMAEARRAGVGVLPLLSDFEANTIGLTELRGASATFAFVTSSLRTVAGAELRSQRALDLICDAWGAEAGHLYLIQGKTLERSASRGQHPAGDAQFQLARQCLDEALNQDEVATEIVSEASEVTPGVARVWTEAGSIEHRSVIITTRVNEALRYAGVAVLIAAAEKPKPEAIATLSAVAKLLLEFGDTLGLAASS